MCQSKEGNFAMAAGSTVGLLSLCPLASSSCAPYQLKSTTKYPLLQGFQQSLVAVSPPLHSTPLSIQSPIDCTLCEKLGVLTVFLSGSSNHSSPHVFYTAVFNFTPSLFPSISFLATKPSQSQNYKQFCIQKGKRHLLCVLIMLHSVISNSDIINPFPCS